MRETAKGAIDRFSVSIENLGIQMASTFLPALTDGINGLQKFIDAVGSWTPSIAVQKKLGEVKYLFKDTWYDISKTTKTALSGMSSDMKTAGDGFSNIMAEALKLVGQIIANGWTLIKPIWKSGLEALGTEMKIWGSVLKGDWDGVWEGLKEILSTKLKSMLTLVSSFAGGLPGLMASAAKGMIRSFVGGIVSGSPKIKKATRIMQQDIYNPLHHSHPKTGLLKDDYKWMPDMMTMFAKGIESNIPKLQMAVGDVTSTISGESIGASNPTNNNTYNTNVSMQSAGFSTDQLARSINRHWMMNGVYS